MKRVLLFLCFAALSLNNPDRLSAQWIQTHGPEGGQVTCLALSGANLFAGTDNGVYLSTDNGTSWTLVWKNGVLSLGVCGTSIFAGDFTSVHRSTDNGASWIPAKFGMGDQTVTAFATIDSVIFAGTRNGVYFSDNDGTSWIQVNQGLLDLSIAALCAFDSTLYAGTWNGGVFRSTNYGGKWTELNTGLIDTLTGHAPVVSSFAMIDTLLFAGTWSGVVRSTDNGSNWSRVSYREMDPGIFALAVNGANLFAGAHEGGCIFRRTMACTGHRLTPVWAITISYAWKRMVTICTPGLPEMVYIFQLITVPTGTP